MVLAVRWFTLRSLVGFAWPSDLWALERRMVMAMTRMVWDFQVIL